MIDEILKYQVGLSTVGLTISPDDFWTEWCYSGHTGRFLNFWSGGVITVISGVDFRTEWCNNGHSGRKFLDRVVL